MLSNINKISVIGGSGTGKTTLSNNLSNNLNIPVYHLDGINYFQNWEPRDKVERDKIILEKIEEPQWIIDGTYNSTLGIRIQKADLIIYLDYSSFAQLKGVMTRFLKNKGKEKSEIPGCKEKMDKEFFLWTLSWRKRKRAKIYEALQDVDKSKVLIFKNRRQLNKWYLNNFNQKIQLEEKDSK